MQLQPHSLLQAFSWWSSSGRYPLGEALKRQPFSFEEADVIKVCERPKSSKRLDRPSHLLVFLRDPKTGLGERIHITRKLWDSTGIKTPVEPWNRQNSLVHMRENLIMGIFNPASAVLFYPFVLVVANLSLTTACFIFAIPLIAFLTPFLPLISYAITRGFHKSFVTLRMHQIVLVCMTLALVLAVAASAGQLTHLMNQTDKYGRAKNLCLFDRPAAPQIETDATK